MTHTAVEMNGILIGAGARPVGTNRVDKKIRRIANLQRKRLHVVQFDITDGEIGHTIETHSYSGDTVAGNAEITRCLVRLIAVEDSSNEGDIGIAANEI